MYLPWTKTLYATGDMFISALFRIVKTGSNPMPIPRIEQVHFCAFKQIQCRNKKEWSTDTHVIMSDSQRYNKAFKNKRYKRVCHIYL